VFHIAAQRKYAWPNTTQPTRGDGMEATGTVGTRAPACIGTPIVFG